MSAPNPPGGPGPQGPYPPGPGPGGPHGPGAPGWQGAGPQGPGAQGPGTPPPGWNPEGVYGGPTQPIQGGPHAGPGQFRGNAQAPRPEILGPGMGPGGNRPAKPADPKRKKLLIGIISAVAAVVLIIGGVIFYNDYQTKQEEARAAEAARIAEENRRNEQQKQSEAAAGAVKTYLTALGSADAEKVLGLAAKKPEGNIQLLTKEVLQEANKRAAITVGEVQPGDLVEDSQGSWSSGKVTATYKIGEKQQDVDFDVSRVGDDWKLAKVSALVKYGLNGPERLVNGTKVAPGSYETFPGSYAVLSANPLIGFNSTEFVLASPVDSTTSWEPGPVLSDEGRKQATDAARAAINACLQKKELAPPDCPFIRFRETNGVKVTTNTISYTLKNDPLASVNWRFSSGTLSASATVSTAIEIRAQATQGARSGPLEPQTATNSAYLNAKLADGKVAVSFT